MTEHTFREFNEFCRLLVRHEGIRLKPYKCTSGKLTIGIGRNLDDVGISEKEAYLLLFNDIEIADQEASKNFPWYKDLNQTRRDVVLSMIFNLGFSGFLAFRKTIQAIKDSDFEKASVEMLDSEWAKQVGKRANELSEMLRTGAYINV